MTNEELARDLPREPQNKGPVRALAPPRPDGRSRCGHRGPWGRRWTAPEDAMLTTAYEIAACRDDSDDDLLTVCREMRRTPHALRNRMGWLLGHCSISTLRAARLSGAPDPPGNRRYERG